jgi:uncharacterized membrane protein YoaK (UPF0700 family)
MFHHRIDRDTPTFVIMHWLLLSFMAGNINAGGLLACGRFVSHMTGFYTLFGQSVAQWRWDEALGMATIPLYFLAGSMISAYLVERPIHQGKRAHYVTVMLLTSACLFLPAILGTSGVMMGDFGGTTHLRPNYVLLALLCLASGLENAAVSCASGHSVRITHMTGNTTDLGIGIVRIFSLRKYTAHHGDEVKAAWLRFGIITAFSVGSAAGAVLFLRYEYGGFLLPAVLALYTAIHEAVAWRHVKHQRPGRGSYVRPPTKHDWKL